MTRKLLTVFCLAIMFGLAIGMAPAPDISDGNSAIAMVAVEKSPANLTTGVIIGNYRNCCCTILDAPTVMTPVSHHAAPHLQLPLKALVT